MSAILLPFCFVLFVVLGATYGGFAIYQYFRVERKADVPRLPVAIAALGLQYLFMFSALASGGSYLAPTIFMLFTSMALIAVIWLGIAARSVGGTRIALSGLFTFVGYACLMVAITHGY
jgi:hypothetical protein